MSDSFATRRSLDVNGTSYAYYSLPALAALNGLLAVALGAFAAHGLDGRINGSAECSALSGMNHFIHRHDRLLSFFSPFGTLIWYGTILCLFSA